MDSDIHEEIVALLSKVNDQIEWVEKLPVTSQDNEEDCIQWLAYLNRVKDTLAGLAIPENPDVTSFVANKE